MQESKVEIITDNETLKIIQKSSKWLLGSALFMIAIGLLAIIFPVVSTLAVNYFIGGILMFAGIIQLFGCTSVKGTSAYFGALLLACLTIAASAFMIFNPLASVIALTLILAILFIIEGVFHIILAVDLKPHSGWEWLLFSGIISLGLGIFVAAGLSEFSLLLLGIVLGINFITTGFAFLFLYSQLNKALESKR